MIIAATMIWDANEHSAKTSRCYSEKWVEKLYRGFKRNITRDFRFICFTERTRKFSEASIEQLPILSPDITWNCLIEPFRLDEPMILVGLDTLITGNIDHFVDYCEKEKLIALPRDPYQPQQSINGVCLIPAGNKYIYDSWRGENDMAWLRTFPCNYIDDLWPGHAISCKASKVLILGKQESRIIYFHGKPKMDTLLDCDFVKENWI